jgi:hypothetical protein
MEVIYHGQKENTHVINVTASLVIIHFYFLGLILNLFDLFRQLNKLVPGTCSAIYK